MPKKADSNQAEIVAALRKCGVFVFSLHEVGKGCPDLLCAFRNRWYMIECKNGERLGWKLTDSQKKFRVHACAPVTVLTSVADAISWVEMVTRGAKAITDTKYSDVPF